MSMHMIKGVIVTGKGKRKQSNSKKLKAAQENHEAFLRSMGINTDKKKDNSKRPALDTSYLKNKQTNVSYSDIVPGNGNKKETIMYTGNELAGVALMHKQAYEPIRKDNKQAAVESARMRRS